ncbi:hypothetical protein MED193_18914 [Roseobacter sp. MED193]|nr:hypothetical protein MED193_18914 [Roseobacter sp. MED193]
MSSIDGSIGGKNGDPGITLIALVALWARDTLRTWRAEQTQSDWTRAKP